MDTKDQPYRGVVTLGFKFFNDETGDSESNNIFNTLGINYDKIKNNSITVYYGNYTTKIAFRDDQLDKLAENDGSVWVEVYVLSKDNDSGGELFKDVNKLSPRIQLSAVPYALSMSGVYYDPLNNSVILGENYRQYINNGSIKAKTQDGLIVQGKVGIGTNNPQYTLDVNGNAELSGNVEVGGREIRAINSAIIKDIVWQ
ncbi:hypothetical protein NO2_1087 [Candidatus Termititenax persephonae]|uniref:Uncharacterized protein n=1 Tax=Candidatus Termititenax persephonae TaxID=2218525 RepID=A0A388THW4_9BACT|nr:hypothetical protein NO2_1087 [Candidatus Termititenax persephonae]